MSHGGKGDKQRRSVVERETVSTNWSQTFGASRLERQVEAERLAKQELEDAVQEGLAKLAD